MNVATKEGVGSKIHMGQLCFYGQYRYSTKQLKDLLSLSF